MQAAATRQWNMYDPYFNLTTLLLHGNPTNGTSFITDASTNNFTVTPVGDTRAANLSPFSLTTFATSGSAYLDGTGDYLSIADNAALDMGSSDFTIEFWTYVTGTPSTYQAYFGKRANTGTYGGVELYLTSSRNLNLQATLNGSTWGVDITTSSTVSLNTWTHVAAVRNGNTWIVYINGTAGATSGTVSGTIPDNANAFVIGAGASDGGHPMIAGYISNFRVVKGTAVYTSNFTPSTSPLTAIANTSLLTLQNSQSANNNAFLDSSSNNFLITRNGNTTQGSFSPFSQAPGYWGNYFDGNSWLSIPSTSNLAFGTGDFCVEFWFYQAGAAAKGIFSNSTGAGGGDTQFEIQINVSSKIVLLGWNSIFLTGATTINAGSWYHIAVLRSGTSMAMFVNGVRDATATSANNFSSTNSFEIGRQATGSGGGYITGYISNFRAVKGASVYNPSNLNITVPTVPLGATSGGQTPPTGTQTSLLTCQSSRFVDNGGLATPNTITVNGTPSVQPFSPFLPTVAYTPQTIGGSGYFDGTGDYLSFPTNSVLVLGSGNFTAEAWVYPTAAVSSTQMIVGSWDGSTTLSWTLSVAATNVVLFEATSSGSYVSPLSFATANNAIRPNSWNHIAVVRSGNAFTIYVNGVSSATATNSITIFNASNNTKTGSNTNSQAFLGYIAGTRVVVGTAVYTGAFTVPTSPFTPTMSANPYGGSNTSAATASALLNYTNAGVVDSTGDNVLETAGDARISTAVSRFGGSSMFFDGTGDAFVSPNSLNFSFGTGDFTIEAWVYPTARGVYPMICKCAVNGTWASGWAFSFGYLAPTEDKVQFWINGSTILQSTNAVPLNTWSHVAVSRSGTSLRMFVNGVQEASATNSTAISPTSVFTVGSDIVTTNYNYFGYIDDLRITRFARYTGAFTPQTSQWQDQ